MVPLNEATVISQTQPAIAGILAVVFLRESYDLVQFLTTIFCTIGVLLITKPGFLFGNAVEALNLEAERMRLEGTFILLFAAVVVSFQMIVIKKLVAHISPNLSAFYIGLIPSLFGSFMMIGKGVKPLDSQTWFYLINIMVFGFLAQVLVNRAFKFGDAGKIGVMSYSQIIFGFLLDMYVLGTTPDFYSAIGAMSIFCCVFLRIYKTWKANGK